MRKASETADLKKLAGALGLAMKAGKVRSGEFASENAIKAGKAKLCLLAGDCSGSTEEKFSVLCGNAAIMCFSVPFTRESFGHVFGRESRAVAVITSDGFAENVIRIIKGGYADGQ